MIQARDDHGAYHGDQELSDAEYLFSVMNEIAYYMNEGLEKKELKIPKQLEGWRCHR